MAQAVVSKRVGVRVGMGMGVTLGSRPFGNELRSVAGRTILFFVFSSSIASNVFVLSVIGKIMQNLALVVSVWCGGHNRDDEKG
jgi:hypothetical protein